MKKIGFLSFGHWTPSPQSKVRTASDALLQSIELAVAAEELGADGAYFRVHHYARQLGSPFRSRRGRRADQAHRDRHRGHRHALREPDVHGGGRRLCRRHQRRPPAARHQPRLARAGDRRLALLRLRAGGRQDRRRHGAAPHRGLSRGAARRRFCAAQSAADVSEPAGPAAPRALRRRPARAHLVGRGFSRHGRMGRQDRHEPAKLDADLRRDRRAARHPASRPDPQIPRGLEGGRAHARAAGFGQPQHLRAGRRSRPRLFRRRQRKRGLRSASSATTGAPCSAAATPPSRTCSSNSSSRTRPSPKPTRSC